MNVFRDLNAQQQQKEDMIPNDYVMSFVAIEHTWIEFRFSYRRIFLNESERFYRVMFEEMCWKNRLW